jgi:hypothetical protein
VNLSGGFWAVVGSVEMLEIIWLAAMVCLKFKTFE